MVLKDQTYNHSDSNLSETSAVFTAPRDRDAWSTIRGFVFQADLTIKRWLDLDADQELQLECGEDIDTVTRYIQSGDAVRLLEQVKHRETNITLKTEGPVAALANALEHRRANPGRKLLFRFTTNARAGKEKFSPFAGSQTGIDAWNSLRKSGTGERPLDNTKEVNLTVGIRKLLSDAGCPDNYPKNEWSLFQGFLSDASDADFRLFVQNFEWSLTVPEAEDMSDSIQQTLLDLGLARDASVAFTQYQRLFLHVLKTLSQRTGKQLTRPVLEAVLAQTVSEADLKFFDSFLGQMGLLDRKLTFLQAQLGRQEGMLDAIAQQIGRVIDLSRLQAFTLTAPVPIFEPPPIEDNISPRTRAVGSLAHELSAFPWLAIAGGSGMGKSYLALLLAAQYTSCPVWLRFRGLSSDQAAKAFDAVFLWINEGQIQSNHQEWHVAVCGRLGDGALIVLDDLPPMTGGDALVQRLELLARACRDTGVRMVTTSVNQLPGVLLRSARGIVSPQAAPPLSELDALEILRGQGAPPEIVGDLERIRFLNNVSRQHPALFAALVAYLQDHDWSLTDQQLSELMQGRFAGSVNEETIGRLLTTVTDELSRDLLYRLTLTFGAVDMETVHLLASVSPAVPRPRERVTALTGLWLQRETAQTLRISPLISVLRNGDLAEDVEQGCHRALAQQTMRKGKLNTNDLRNAITHFAAAQDHEEAVLLLLWSLAHIHVALQTQEISIHEAKRSGLLDLLWQTPVPDTVSLNSRLLLRAYQVLLGTEMGTDLTYVVEDLSRLIGEAGVAEATGLLAAAFFAVPHLALSNFEASCLCLIRAITTLPMAALPDGSPLGLPPEITAGSILWLNLTGIQTMKEVLRWLEMLGQVSAEIREQALNDPLFADQGLSLLMDRFWLTEAAKPSSEQDWAKLLTDMDVIDEKAHAVGAEFLQATAIRGKILILCEYVKEPDRAITVAKEGLARLPDEPRIRFTLCDPIGRKLSYLDGREKEAKYWLLRAEEACELLPDALPFERASTLLALARLADKRGEPGEAAAILLRAADLVQNMAFLPEIESVKMQGDLAIARWKQGDQVGAFAALDDAAPRLLKLKENTDTWKAVFAIFGHTAGYMAGHARNIPLSLDNGDPYVLPPIGNFHDPKEADLARAYRSETDLLLPAVMARFAVAVGEDDRAVYWANRTIEIAKNAPATAVVQATTIIEILPFLLFSERYQDFFDSVREATFTLRAAWWIHKQGNEGPLLSEIDVESSLGGRNGAEWEAAETGTLSSIIVPLMLHLGTLAVRSRRDAGVVKFLERSTKTCASLCVQMASISTLSATWREAATLLTDVFLGRPVLSTLISKGNNYSSEATSLKAMAYIAASLEQGVSPREACQAQMAVLSYCRQFLAGEASQRLLLVPFVEEYWGQMLTRSRFLFTPPSFVEQEFYRACVAPDAQKAKQIMQVMASGLGVRRDPIIEKGFMDWDVAEAQRFQQAVQG